jgi:hypothetical protein
MSGAIMALDRTLRLALVGSGSGLKTALETLRSCPGATIVVVADVSGPQSEGARLARDLGIPVVTNPMEVFRSDANVVLELGGENRQYDRLLAVKPPGVEILSARGARLLLDLLRRGNGRPPGEGAVRVRVIVAAEQSKLYAYLKEAFAGVHGVDVILDERRTERRQRLRAQASERRRADRRTAPSPEKEFRAHGFAIRRQDTTGASRCRAGGLRRGA